MAEKLRAYFFKIHLDEVDSERFETFVRETGMKKLAVAKKGILKYIDDNQPNSGN